MSEKITREDSYIALCAEIGLVGQKVSAISHEHYESRKLLTDISNWIKSHSDEHKKHDEKQDKINHLIRGNGDPRKSVLFRLDKSCDFIDEQKKKQSSWSNKLRPVFYAGTIITLIITFLGAANQYGRLENSVDNLKTEVTRIRDRIDT